MDTDTDMSFGSLGNEHLVAVELLGRLGGGGSIGVSVQRVICDIAATDLRGSLSYRRYTRCEKRTLTFKTKQVLISVRVTKERRFPRVATRKRKVGQLGVIRSN